MFTHHYSRKQRQIKNLIKKLNILLTLNNSDLKSEIDMLSNKIKALIRDLKGIVSTNKISRLVGGLALFLGISFTNTANAQWFAYPIQDPFNLEGGDDVEIISAEFADLDNDGDLDYLSGEYVSSSWGYSLSFIYQENIGNSTSPSFNNPVVNPFGLTGYSSSLPQFGIRQTHKFIDLDNDGDFDILSNVSSIDISSYQISSDFIYYENIGTPSTPLFSSPSTNQFGLTASATIVYTDLADLDGDGDTDLLGFSFDYNNNSASTIFIENIGTPSLPNFSSAQINPFGLPSGVFNFIDMSDIDSDGDIDILFTDDYTSAFQYVENIGTSLAPQFSSPPTQNPFGLTFPTNWQGMGVPNLKDIDGDGDNDLILGTDDEMLLYYENVGIQQPITFECINYSCVDPGTGSGQYTIIADCNVSCIAPITFRCDDYTYSCYDPGDGSGFYLSLQDCQSNCIAPISWNCDGTGNCYDPGDGYGQYSVLENCEYDCVSPAISWDCESTTKTCSDPGTGNGQYSNLADCQTACSVNSTIDTKNTSFKLYPNPAIDILNLSSDDKIIKIDIFDALGRIIYTEINPQNNIDIKNLDNGLYTISVHFSEYKIITRFAK